LIKNFLIGNSPKNQYIQRTRTAIQLHRLRSNINYNYSTVD